MTVHPFVSGLPGTIVDTHAYVFHRGLEAAPGCGRKPGHDVSLDNYLALLAANGLTNGVLVQPAFLGRDNRFLLASLERAQGRCRGVAAADPASGAAMLESMNGAGVVGIRLDFFGVPPPDLAAPAWQGLLEIVNALDWHVEVHCAMDQLPDVAGSLLAQECKVVVDCFGSPDFFGSPDSRAGVEPAPLRRLLDLASTGRVWLKLSAGGRIGPEYRVEPEKAMVQLFIQHFSPRRLMWGSNWPRAGHDAAHDYRAGLNWLVNSVENPEDALQMLSDTPKDLFRF